MLFRKHKIKVTILVAVVITLLLMPSAMSVTYATEYDIGDGEMIAGEIVVKFDKNTLLEEVEASAAEGGYTVIEYHERVGLARFGLPTQSGDIVVADIRAADALPGVNTASPNYIYTIDSIINENAEKPILAEGNRNQEVFNQATGETMEIPLVIMDSPNAITDYYYQWGYFAIEADIIWVDKAKMPGVAVLDTGVDGKHPDLKGRVKSGWDYVNDDKNADDDNGQGTHIAGVIAANVNNDNKKFNGGIPGIASGVQIVSYKILNAQGSGTSFDAAMAIYDATDNSAVRILNMSFGFPASDSTLANAVAYAAAFNQLMVVAAGDDNLSLDCAGNMVFPACYVSTYPNNIIVVGATGNDTSGNGSIDYDQGNSFDEQHCKATYSNYGGYIDIIAPGTDIYSTVPTGGYNSGPYNFSGYASFDGTTIAAPHVAAAAARVWATYPELSAGGVKNKLLTSDTVSPSTDALCWPNAADIRPFLNVAGAMDRFAINSRLFNAYTGVGIFDATIETKGILNGKLSNVGVKDQLKSKNSTPTNDWNIINIPEIDNVTVYVNAKGFTKGAQPYRTYGDFSTSGGVTVSVDWSSIPMISKNIAFVADWWGTWNDIADIYIFYPDTPTDYNWLGTNVPFGTAVDNDQYSFEGDLAFHPYMQVMYRNWLDDFSYVGNSLQMKKDVWNSGDTYFVLRDGKSAFVKNVGDLCAWIWENGTVMGSRCLYTVSGNPNWHFATLHPDGTYTFYDNIIYSDAGLNALIPDSGGGGNGAFDADPKGSGPVPPQP